MPHPLTSLAVTAFAASVLDSTAVLAANTNSHDHVDDHVIQEQRENLAKTTKDAGFGPQSPRDLSQHAGENTRAFSTAPAYTAMNLCDIHFHENAEHKGGEFTTYAGNGNGKGFGTGFKYDGTLTDAELTPVGHPVGDSEYGDLQSGDTIEIHFVHSTAQAQPGPTLGTCLSDAIANPQLRVETVVAVLVNDPKAADFTKMAAVSKVDGLYQAENIPNNLGTPVLYEGSTTGPSYNEKGSPFQVTWSVRPQVIKVDINSVDAWFKDNVFHEDRAHGVRNLVENVHLLSPIDQ